MTLNRWLYGGWENCVLDLGICLEKQQFYIILEILYLDTLHCAFMRGR